jgi:tetratricopeptide (TPR) repeat protein
VVAAQCIDQKYKDSIVQHYLKDLAWQKGYNHPNWDRYCDTVIALCPDIAEAYREKAIPHIKYANLAIAMPLEDKAVELSPGEWLDYRAFLKVIFTKDYEGALVDFENAEKQKPLGGLMDHTYSFYKGLSYLGLGEYSKAIDALDQDIKTQSNYSKDAYIHFNTFLFLGIAHYKNNNLIEAENYINRCLKNYEAHPDALYYLGMINTQNNNKTEALANFTKSLNALKIGYSMNEDNESYCNYPFQITTFEVENAILELTKK